MDETTVGGRIKDRRIELSMTQEELARRVGYKSRSAIQKIEVGTNELKQKQIAAFAKALLTTPGFLMGWVDDKRPELSGEELRILLAYRDASEDTRSAVRRVLDIKEG